MIKTFVSSFKYCAILLVIFSYSAKAQTVFEPVQSSIYDFLDLMAQKGIIEFHDEIRPVSREYLANKLMEINVKQSNADSIQKVGSNELTGVEKDELNFYLKDFGMEIANINKNSRKNEDIFSKMSKESENIKSENSDRQIINHQQTDGNSAIMQTPVEFDTTYETIVNKDPFERYRLFSYANSLFKINAGPILGYELGTRDGAKYSHRWNGLYMYGYLSKDIGFNFRFQDNSEDGTTVDHSKRFTPTTGVIIAKTDVNNIQYSEVNVNVAYNWSWGQLSAGKDFLNWGYGQSGLLVLSDKAPSFPFIRLDLCLASWLRFNYIHAWLSSDVIDSTQTYYTALQDQPRTIYRDKYLAQHTLTITPTRGLDVSIGESIVYSDRLQISYLIPIMFFRLADHYLSRAENAAGGNSQFFLGVSSRNQIKNTHLYGTIFIDEITLESAFDPVKQRNQFGFTLGGSITDLPLDNLTFTAEFTKIFPYVYTHFISTQTYQSSGYVMGHWMGNNADLAYGALKYKFLRGLNATLWAQYVRKGGQGPEVDQYTQPQPPFLYGLRTNYSYLGLEIKYEIIHELFARLQFQTTNTSSQQTNLSFSDHRMNEFYVALYYGIL